MARRSDSSLIRGVGKAPRQQWERPWGVLQAWTCSSGYRMVRAQVRGKARMLLVGYGDLHYGSPHHDPATATAVRDWIKTADALWVGMGDFVECATRDSVGAGVYEQVRSPDEQIEDVVPFLRPIREQCIGLIKGNHEERAHKLAGIDPMAIIARELDVPYCGWEAWGLITRLPKPDRSWTFYAVHSSAANKSGGLALAWTDRELRKFADTDIIFRAHSHDLAYQPVEVLSMTTVGQNPAVEQAERAIVSTGSFLLRAGSYAAGKAMAPKTGGAIALELAMSRNAVGRVRPIWLPE